MAKKLRVIAKKAEENNVVISIVKLDYGSETTYSGFHLRSVPGGVEVTPDPKRTEAIGNLESPKNKKELISFMGAASQLASWCPRYSFHREGLAHLCKRDSAWV